MPTSETAVSLSHPDFWARPPAEREATFAVLRREAPVSWQPPTEGGLRLLPPGPDEPGYWAVVRHEDVVTVSRDPQSFSSASGATLEPIPRELVEAAASILGMDPPRHSVFRRLISSTFTPGRVGRIEGQIAAQARRIVDELLERGPCNFVEAVSQRLPMWTIAEMIGVAPDDRQRVTAAADAMVAWNDPEFHGGGHALDTFVRSMLELRTAAMELAAFRRRRPADDLMSALVQATVDGHSLSDDEIGAFFVLLSVAGNDTTRHTISHATLALSANPDRRAFLAADFDGRIRVAVEEFVRWATPVISFRRTALRSTVLDGQPIAEGDWVVMFYSSANRDEAVFDDPGRFDPSRTPNPHVGFGGGGPHFCLGAFLARTQLRALFHQLFERVPNLEVGDPEYLVSNFINGIKRLPCDVPR
jgi:cytochrome P450